MIQSSLEINDNNIGKEQLEELKKMKKTKEPILTVEEKASKSNKQEIKGTGKLRNPDIINLILRLLCNSWLSVGFNMQMFSSEKGKVMIEN